MQYACMQWHNFVFTISRRDWQFEQQLVYIFFNFIYRDQSSHHRDSRKISQVLDSLRDRRTRTSLTGRSTRLSTLKPLFDNNLNKTYSESSIAAMEMIGTPDLQKDCKSQK